MPLKYDTPEVRESFWKRVDKRGPDGLTTDGDAT